VDVYIARKKGFIKNPEPDSFYNIVSFLTHAFYRGLTFLCGNSINPHIIVCTSGQLQL
jgi:hypothetical protein